MKKTLLKIALGAGIFIYLLRQVGMDEIWSYTSTFKPEALFVMWLITLSVFLLGGVTVVLLGRGINPELSWSLGIRGFLGSTSLALFVPGRVGDFTLPLYWKHTLDAQTSFSIVLVDKLITLFWVVSLGSLGIYVYFKSMAGFLVIGILGLVFLALCAGLRIKAVSMILKRLLPETVFAFLSKLLHAVMTIFTMKRRILLISAITGFRVCLGGSGFMVAMWGQDVSIGILDSILSTATAQITSLLPISIIGFGPMEAVYVLCLERIGMGAGPILVALMARHIITLFWYSLFFYMFNLLRDPFVPQPLSNRASSKSGQVK